MLTPRHRCRHRTPPRTGVIGFGAASAVAGAAPNITTLIAARAVQGCFAAALAPAALSMIAVSFTDPKELHRAFGIFGAVSGSAGAIGLLLGGILTGLLDWRRTMYVNLVFAVVGVVGAVRVMHNSADADKPRLSVPSTVLGSAALFAMVFAVARAETDGWSAAVTVTSLAVGAVLLVVFVAVQHYERHPLIPLRVIMDRTRGAAYLASWGAAFACFAVFLLLTFYFQRVLGYSPIRTGVVFVPLPQSMAVAATVTQGPLLKHLTARTIVVGGLALSGIGCVLLTRAGTDTAYAAWVLPGLVLLGAGIGSAIVVAAALGQLGVHTRDAGTAGALVNVSQQLGSAIGVALVSTFAATATSDYLTSRSGSDVQNRADVHGFVVDFWWAAGVYFVVALVAGAMLRPGLRLHQPPGPAKPVPDPIAAIV